jgi:hypothetical protein
MIGDATTVKSVTEPDEIELSVAVWPFGEATVHLTFEEQGDQTLVTMDEESTSGPARFMPRPIESLLLRLRNLETLKRLGYLAESGARSKHGPHSQS